MSTIPPETRTDTAATDTAVRYPSGMRRAGVFFGGIWLIILAEPVSDMFNRGLNAWQEALGTAIFVAFCLTYLATIRVPFRGSPGDPPMRYMPYVLLALALAWLPFTGVTGLGAFTFVTVSMQANLRQPEALGGTAAVVAALALTPRLPTVWQGSTSSYAVSAAAGALAMFGIARLAERNRELHAAQVELARLAVLGERERFARDLHDILGHSLTVVAMKAELAGKLIEGDPTAARHEVADIERLARDALADVRATVAGYREVTWVGELSSARVALQAAEIRAELPTAVDAVPGEHRELYGWVVREGITNVVRHSGASACCIRLLENGIEVVDDGARLDDGHRAGGSLTDGSGLRGLRERVAAAGGRLEAGPCEGGGYRLLVVL
jgi:two-component system sensor histidine kinase DesK